MSDFKVILLLSVMVITALVIMAQFPQVFAISADQINLLDVEIASLQTKLLSYDGLISEARTVWGNSEKIVKEKKEELRITKRDEGKSWTGKEQVQSVQESLDKSLLSVQEAREKYISTLRERSDVIKKIRELKDERKSLELQLIISGQPKGLGKIIGIDLSQGCITQIKNNFTTDCPTYLDLKEFDSSRQEVSGYFIDDGFYHRDTPVQKNSWRLYDHDPTPRIMVDPPLGMSERIRLITIQDNFDVYLLPDSLSMLPSYQLVNITKSADEWGKEEIHSGLNKTSYFNTVDTASRTIYHDRYVDAKCKQAIINADKWEILLPDTITYMQNNCDDSKTLFVHKEIITENLTPQDITTSQKYKDEQRLKWIIQNCLKTYGFCK